MREVVVRRPSSVVRRPSSVTRPLRRHSMWIRVNSQKPLVWVLGGLVVVAWLALWLWGASPYGRFLTHEQIGEVHLGDHPLQMAVFVAGWTLMTVAMMLPTSLPLVVLFYGLIARRHDRLRLTVLLVAGYL